MYWDHQSSAGDLPEQRAQTIQKETASIQLVELSLLASHSKISSLQAYRSDLHPEIT